MSTLPALFVPFDIEVGATASIDIQPCTKADTGNCTGEIGPKQTVGDSMAGGNFFEEAAFQPFCCLQP
jgi:hypothetical protein